MGYKRDTLKGISWVGAVRFVSRAVAFLKNLFLARLLTPSEFGLFGIASLILALLEVLTETGVNIVLIQKKDEIHHYLNSAWVVSILRGVVISLIMILAAPLIAAFFHSPSSTQLITAFSIVPFIRGFINPSVVKLQKDLQFHKEFMIRSIVFLVDAIVAIYAAFMTHQAISFVYGMTVSVIVEVLLTWVFIRPLPQVSLDMSKVTEIIHKGKWITLAGICNYLFQNADNIAVGKLLNIQALGLYEMAYTIAIVPVTEVAEVFQRVMFPVFVRISHDKARLQRAFLFMLAVVSLLSSVFGIILFFFAKDRRTNLSLR